MERKIQNQEEHIRFLYDELESKETEIDDLKRSLDKANDLCRLRSVSKSNYDEDISELKKLAEEQKLKIMCLRKHRSEILDRHEKMVDDYEAEFKAKEHDVKNLQENAQLMKQKISDQKEELDSKVSEIAELKKVNDKMNIKNASISLSEEIKTAGLNVENERLKNLIEKMKTGDDDKTTAMKKERAFYLAKLDKASTTMKSEMEKLQCSFKGLAKVNKQARCPFEWNCNRLFCNLDHTYLYRKVNDSETTKATTKPVTEFSCKQCGLKVRRKSQLDVHIRLKHEDVAHFACKICTFKCNNQNKLQAHMKQQHQISCTKCDKTFHSITSLEDHMEKHVNIKEGIAATGKIQRRSKKKAKKNINSELVEKFNKITETPKDDIDDEKIEVALVEDSFQCLEEGEELLCTEESSNSSLGLSKS